MGINANSKKKADLQVRLYDRGDAVYGFEDFGATSRA